MMRSKLLYAALGAAMLGSLAGCVVAPAPGYVRPVAYRVGPHWVPRHWNGWRWMPGHWG